MTALRVASVAGQSAVITLLLDHGADVHAVTGEVTVELLLHVHDDIIRTYVNMYV